MSKVEITRGVMMQHVVISRRCSFYGFIEFSCVACSDYSVALGVVWRFCLRAAGLKTGASEPWLARSRFHRLLVRTLLVSFNFLWALAGFACSTAPLTWNLRLLQIHATTTGVK